MYILGISSYYHESSASLIKDGEIIAAASEERFTRVKHDNGFPYKAIDFCLNFAHMNKQDLDFVAYYEKPFQKFERNLITSIVNFPYAGNYFIESMKNSLTEKLWVKATIINFLKIDPNKIVFIPHHLSHAAASFYPSPFTKSAFLTLDGIGEWTTGCWGFAKDNKITPLYELRYPDSIGLFYSTFTAFLGFEVNDGEYKVMGMAGYGKPKYINKVKKTVTQLKDGSIKLDLSFFDFQKNPKRMYSQKFIDEFKDIPRFDLASSLQKVTEDLVINILKYVQTKTNEENIVFGGGVALNSVLNGKIIKETKFKNIFIFPAAGDDGTAVGSALYLYHHVFEHKKRFPLKNVFLGMSYSNKDIEQFLKKEHIVYNYLPGKKCIDYIVNNLIQGKVLGLFEGKAEFGPRALGHRSILADPRNKHMKDLVNKKIKYREEFRPFAPAVLEEYADKYYTTYNQNLSPYMLETCFVTKKGIIDTPATTHVDKTSRIQIVKKDYPGKFRPIIEEFYKNTNVPVLLNTSFNVKGEPIVDSPQDALNTFSKSGLDILVLENYIIEK